MAFSIHFKKHIQSYEHYFWCSQQFGFFCIILARISFLSIHMFDSFFRSHVIGNFSAHSLFAGSFLDCFPILVLAICIFPHELSVNFSTLMAHANTIYIYIYEYRAKALYLLDYYYYLFILFLLCVTLGFRCFEIPNRFHSDIFYDPLNFSFLYISSHFDYISTFFFLLLILSPFLYGYICTLTN